METKWRIITYETFVEITVRFIYISLILCKKKRKKINNISVNCTKIKSYINPFFVSKQEFVEKHQKQPYVSCYNANEGQLFIEQDIVFQNIANIE